MPAQTIQTMPREEFIEKNLGLVHACAGRFKSRGIEYEELYAAGCLGLVKAVDGFDTTRGVCFSTYAVPVILGEIKKLFRDGGTVKVSRSLKELGLKVNAERERCLKHTGQEPSWLKSYRLPRNRSLWPYAPRCLHCLLRPAMMRTATVNGMCPWTRRRKRWRTASACAR